jgi:hypothetical protein
MKNAAFQAMEKLKTYYQKTDAVVFTAATLIDPRLKLSYHEEHKWEKSYIDAARRQFELLFKQNYYHPVIAAENDNEVDEDLISHIYMQHRSNPEQDEVNLYLAAARANGKAEVLQWWKVIIYFYFDFLLAFIIYLSYGFSSPMKLITHNWLKWLEIT